MRDWGSGTWTWNTSGNVAGSYTISVWARNVGSAASWETYKETLFTLSSPPPCTSVSVTTGVASPQQPGVAVAFTATAAGCTTPEYRFLLLPPGGGWQVVREWGAGTWTWNTTGASLGNYTISVWARNVGSAASWETYKETPFALQTPPPPPPCTSVSVTTGVASPQQPGVAVAFTATAAGCTTPEYRFWVLPPGGGWQIMRDWGSGTWTWNTSGNVAGSYTISVWARNVGSAASWETYKETPFTLSSPPPCTSVGVTTGVASPQQPGVAVAFTATAAGCTTPEYRFLLLPPGGGWQVVREWGAGTWTWNTTGASLGIYTISVWARNVGSAASWETYKETPFALQTPPPPPPCTSVSVTPGVASPQQPGVAVAFTATAAGCTTPEYRFWVLPPGGGWQIMRDWGSGTWTWNTSGNVAGSYTISVWARNVGSAASWETYKETPFTLQAPAPPPPCTSVQRHAWRGLAARTPGVPVAFTATAAGCPTPEYRFLLLPPGGGWQVVREWGAGTWTWNTSSNVAGSFADLGLGSCNWKYGQLGDL